MQIIETKIEKIKPDPNQPRTSIDELDLREMAQSIVTEGVINPIEVDKKFVIITGERRWRAAKIAGLKTVPVKVLDLDKNHRFMRQVIENVHNNTMNDWDTSNALKRLLTMWPGPIVPHAPKVGTKADQGYTWLSKKIGKSRRYIDEKLSLLEATKAVQSAVKRGQITGSYVRAINRAPEQYKKEIEKKILGGEFKSYKGALNFASALIRTKNPHLVKKLFDIDYSKHETEKEVESVVSKISPPAYELIKKTFEPSKEIGKIADDLKDWIQRNPKEKVGVNHIPRIIINMNFMKTAISAWMGDDKRNLGSGDRKTLLDK